MIKQILQLIILLSCLNLLKSDGYAWTPSDTLQIKEIGKIAISPTEEQIAYEVMTPIVNEAKGLWQTEIHIAPAGHSTSDLETKRIRLNDYVANSIEWFPDGKSFFFLTKTNNRTQICRFFIENNKLEVLLDETYLITTIASSHQGNQIAFLALDKPKTNDFFEIVDEFTPKHKLYLLNLASQNIELLIEEDTSIGSFNWSPTDEFIVFDYQTSAQVEDKVFHSKISKIHVPSRTITPVINNSFSNFNPQYSPDGQWIAYTSGPGTWEFTFHMHLIDNFSGRQIQLPMTPDEQPEFVGWLSDSESLVIAERYHTIQRLYLLSMKELEARPITPIDTLILQPKISSKGNLIAFRGESSLEPSEVFMSGISFNPIQVSHAQTAIHYPKLNTQVISWTTSDGKIIEGLLTLPTIHADAPFPLLVLIRGHSNLYLNTYEGGIHLAKTPYSIGVFADQGYAVLRPFFRGSFGYSRLMRNSIHGDWGGKDFDDLIEGIDFLIHQGLIDPDRLGVLGWSYGGFMTANAVTKTDRFKAASAGGALVDFISYAGTTDVPHFLPYYMNGWFWDNPQAWRDHSPIEHVAKIKTPTLIQHSSGDKRVPVSQAFEFYSALKHQDIPTKLILYSDSGHTLSNPKMMIEGLQHNVNWFNLWMKGKRETKVGGARSE